MTMGTAKGGVMGVDVLMGVEGGMG